MGLLRSATLCCLFAVDRVNLPSPPGMLWDKIQGSMHPSWARDSGLFNTVVARRSGRVTEHDWSGMLNPGDGSIQQSPDDAP